MKKLISFKMLSKYCVCTFNADGEKNNTCANSKNETEKCTSKHCPLWRKLNA